MSKQKFLFLSFLVVSIIAGGFFIWKGEIINKREVVIGNQKDSIVDLQNATISDQPASSADRQTDSGEQPASSADKQTVSSEQPASSADRQSAISEQDAITNKQNSADKTQKVIVNKNSITGKIVAKLVSWGFQKVSDRKIDTIVLHSSYDALGDDPFSVVGVIEEYKQAQVAPHYLIARDGTVYQLVADQNIAWHAGVAKMPDGRTNVNSFSLGIEIINTKDGKFTAEQYGAVNRLIGDLKKAYPIKNILGHSDIAPDRKTDPWGIDWKKINR